ncbi:MAG: UDP-N-acetylglucosamine 1-carboxyvinyltransferase [Pseudomonadota bacterium]
MDSIHVRGGKELSGSVSISGAKNTALKLMPASILTDQPVTLTNMPSLSDVRTLAELLGTLGTETASLEDGHVMTLVTKDIINRKADYDIVRKLRASFNVLGPLLAREGEAIVSLPGGCAIGARKVDLHLDALEKLGATIELVDGYVHASAPNGLTGTVIEFPFVSVGATENALTAATLAKGTTVIKNAAREPDTVDLAKFLSGMGAKISGAGTSTITVESVESLHGVTHEVIADRIELGTYMIAPAIAGGEIELKGGRLDLIEAFAEKLDAAGMQITQTNDGLKVKRVNGIKSVDVATAPFPGFPTDLQAQFMALMCTAEGTSKLEETIFENRFMHAPELIRMGADIDVEGGTAIVKGVPKLQGAPVMATDLRASVSLILAGLAAGGETKVARVYHLDRGYEHVVAKFRGIGAVIERIKE